MPSLAAIRSFGCAAALIALPGIAMAQSAKKPYDGTWNVTLNVSEGRCIRVNYPATIQESRLVYSGIIPVTVEGGVSPHGHVKVKLTYQGQSATGSGKVRKDRASGVWNAPPLNCKGTWVAERVTTLADQ